MKPLSILVADDEPEIRELILRWLEREGHYVTCAVNGAEAAAISQAKAFDLIVTDVIMPERDGVQLITEIKKSRPGARVLAISGGGRVLDGMDCLRMAQGLGAHGAIMKPFNREAFLAAVDQALAPKPASGTAPK
jgi:CheY-like chemotaxis protein